jgi:hypothetical protein
MSEALFRRHKLSASLQNAIDSSLHSNFNLRLSDDHKLAANIKTLSDFYIDHPGAPTPWAEKWCQIAYLGYYLPLNIMRANSVFKEAHARNFPISENIIDFGSGLGSGSFGYAEVYSKNISKLTNVETANHAINLHQELIAKFNSFTPHKVEWKELIRKTDPKSTAVFSYSLAELKSLPDWASECENLVIIEPSTRDIARRLLEVREGLQKNNFYVWAPCTHQEACPLLHKSKTDWCHDRIHFDAPDWFLEIEKHLPFKNHTLTFSYLLMSKQKPSKQLSHSNHALSSPLQARTTGDLLREKGKSRQLICRSQERELLTWMHKNIDEQEIPRGMLVKWPLDFEAKSNEIRVNSLIELVD